MALKPRNLSRLGKLRLELPDLLQLSDKGRKKDRPSVKGKWFPYSGRRFSPTNRRKTNFILTLGKKTPVFQVGSMKRALQV